MINIWITIFFLLKFENLKIVCQTNFLKWQIIENNFIKGKYLNRNIKNIYLYNIQDPGLRTISNLEFEFDQIRIRY